MQSRRRLSNPSQRSFSLVHSPRTPNSLDLWQNAQVLLVQDDATAWLVPAFFVITMALLILLEARWFQSIYGPIRLRFKASEMRRIL